MKNLTKFHKIGKNGETYAVYTHDKKIYKVKDYDSGAAVLELDPITFPNPSTIHIIAARSDIIVITEENKEMIGLLYDLS